MSLSELIDKTRNPHRVTHWLSYETESKIVFGDKPRQGQHRAMIELPPGTGLSSRLEEETEDPPTDQSQVGDPHCRQGKKSEVPMVKGRPIVPVGATMGAAIRLHRGNRRTANYTGSGIRRAAIAGRKARFFAR